MNIINVLNARNEYHGELNKVLSGL